MIQVGDKLPAATLQEFIEVEGDGCSIGPNAFETGKATAGKTIALFALPGAYTPTCSAKHVPGYVARAAELRAAGVDEIWCVSVNDAFVMGAWAKHQDVPESVHMLADGNGTFTKALGLELDATPFGMGLRSKRFAIVADDGVVTHVHVEAPGEFKVSAADYVLEHLG